MKLNISNKVTLMKAQARFLAGRAREKVEELLKDESGMGTVEVILIIVVLIGLVIIFKEKTDGLVKEIFNTINTKAGKVTG
ncbi:Flp1 family type IVb pilin [Butyrivibrio sp. LC3010]|uniref:Flp1 family type IVb pilin n=1 Tax=Butyrivibrio sp. LC3010 TaxID=1280680 RepID=UPI000428969D|nr:Flp1 family type IVb pilin [Butyrivibrio sp. LC3010]